MRQSRARNPELFLDTNSNLVDMYGNIISTSPPIYTYGSHPAAWNVPLNTKIFFHPNMLLGSNATTSGIEVISDQINWKPAGRGQILYSGSGSVTTPLVSGLAGNGGTEVNMYGGSLSAMTIPANLLYKGCRLRLQALVQKTGSTATWDLYCKIGISSTYTANDVAFGLATITNASGRQFWVDTELIVTTAGDYAANPSLGGSTAAKFTPKNWLTRNSSATSPIADQGNQFSTIAQNYIHINIKGTSPDTFSLIDYSLEWLP